MLCTFNLKYWTLELGAVFFFLLFSFSIVSKTNFNFSLQDINSESVETRIGQN